MILIINQKKHFDFKKDFSKDSKIFYAKTSEEAIDILNTYRGELEYLFMDSSSEKNDDINKVVDEVISHPELLTREARIYVHSLDSSKRKDTVERFGTYFEVQELDLNSKGHSNCFTIGVGKK